MTVNSPESPIGEDVGILEGGNLNGSYQIQQFHFHWGQDDSQGSEHTLTGERYNSVNLIYIINVKFFCYSFPMEMHIVHYQIGIADPTLTEGGVAVLGFFFQISVRIFS